MKQIFEEIKQRYPKTAKALGITADMDYEDWLEVSHRAAVQKLMRPLPLDISGLSTSAATHTFDTTYTASTATRQWVNVILPKE